MLSDKTSINNNISIYFRSSVLDGLNQGIGLNQPILGTTAAAVRDPQQQQTATLKGGEDGGALWPKSPANLYPFTYGIKSLERYVIILVH